MKMRTLFLLVVALITMNQQLSAKTDLHSEREAVIREYINNLQKADAAAMTQLFMENGTVISTSKGKVNAKDFFHAFLPSISFATTEIHQSFINNYDNNRYAARFHFNFTLKDGETGNGEYMDEFVFVNNSAKLSSVSMFENLVFDEKNMNVKSRK